MFFGNKKMDAEGFDMSTKEGREKAKARLMEVLSTGSEREKRSAKILNKLFDVMDDVPEPFAVVHETIGEINKMVEVIERRQAQLIDVARNLDDPGLPVHRFGAVEGYLTVAAGALSAASMILGRLESYVAKQSERAQDDGPLPTEPPPAPAPTDDMPF